jgi:hypothetical protein
MTALPNLYPYGMRQIMLTPYLDAQGSVLGTTSYPLPAAMTMAFSETEQFDELRGDDVLIAVHGRGAQVDWSLEAGGLPLKAWSIISGAMVITEGVAPNRRTRVLKSGDDVRPYFRTDGRAISDSGGSVNARIYRCKANGRLQADMRGGAFQTTNIDGIGIPLLGDSGRWLYELIQNESDSALPGTPEANPLPIPANLRAGTILATSVILSWDANSAATGYRVQKSIDAGVTWTAVASGSGGEPITNTTTITTLTTATSYQFRVASYDGTNTGDYSNPVIVTTA